MIFNTKIEGNDTKEIINSEYVNFDFFKNSTVLITGATGLIGKQVVNTLLYANEVKNTNISIVALVRNKKKAQEIFEKKRTNKLKFVVQDITEPLKTNLKVDYIIHTANSTSSKSFVETPVETINSIVQGTKNILNFAKKKRVKSVVYLSSMEVFGNIDTERVEPLKETDYGYIDIAKVRNSYSEGKRLAEAMCISYFNEYKVPVKVARLAQTIGAGVDYNDGRIFAEFARCIVEKRDITLKTEGKTVRSYLYVTDCVTAILSMLEKGKNGEIYNVANSDTTCSIKEMAEMLCDTYTSSKLVFNIDNKYYPDTTKYYLDTTWQAKVDLKEMFHRLISNFYYSIISKDVEKEIPRNPDKDSFLEQIFSIKNHQTYKVIKILGLPILKIDRSVYFNKYCMNLPIQKNKIVFANFKGSGYGCNPKYIAEEILKRGLNYDLVWLVKKNIDIDTMPKEIRIIDFNSKKALRELATAKIWIDNQRKLFHIKRGLRKKDGQCYIQTWHGSLGIKKIGVACSKTNLQMNDIFLTDAGMLNFILSNSTFENNVFQENFYNYGELKEYGHPRNDIFFHDNENLKNIKQRVCNTLNISIETKILLYAPSYRDDGNLTCFNLDCNNIIETLCNITHQKWVLLVRLHPNLIKVSQKIFNFDTTNVFDATKYHDIQELLISSDMMITDYSSCIFDFMLSRKPAFIFATDIEHYNTERGFYYPLESTPFPVATNNEQLVENISNFDYEKYKNEVEQFLKDKGCIEDGHASERVVDLIEEIMKND